MSSFDFATGPTSGFYSACFHVNSENHFYVCESFLEPGTPWHSLSPFLMQSVKRKVEISYRIQSSAYSTKLPCSRPMFDSARWS